MFDALAGENGKICKLNELMSYLLPSQHDPLQTHRPVEESCGSLSPGGALLGIGCFKKHCSGTNGFTF